MSTTVAGRMGARTSEGYRHDLMACDGVDDLVRRSGQFAREGVRRGERVMVAMPSARLRAVQRLLGRDGSAVTFVDMERLGGNPARILQAWVEFSTAGAGQAMRGLGEPLWAGRSTVEVEECQLHEALLNTGIPADAPLWLRCPYDSAALSHTVLDDAVRAHPWVAGADGGAHANGRYAGRRQGEESFAAPLAAAPPGSIVREITPSSLRAVRDLAVHAARVVGVEGPRAADLALALHELCVNTLVHGDGRGTLRLWRDPGALVCEVADQGVVSNPLAGRIAPGDDEVDGRGLWMVNQLCDLVQLRSGTQGTTVRVHTWL